MQVQYIANGTYVWNYFVIINRFYITMNEIVYPISVD